MSEPTSNNDSATGTFSLFETFQSSGDAIPSLDSISLSGELPQLPTNPAAVVAEERPAEQPVKQPPVAEQPVVEVDKPVSEAAETEAAVVAEPVVAKPDVAGEPDVEVSVEPAGVSNTVPVQVDEDNDFEIDPVLRPPVPRALPATDVAPVSASPVVDNVVEERPPVEPAVAAERVVKVAVEPAVASVEDVPSPVVESQPLVEPVAMEKPAAAAEPKPLTIEEIVAAAAARVQETVSAPVQAASASVVPGPVVDTKPVAPVAERVESPSVQSSPVAAASGTAVSEAVVSETPASSAEMVSPAGTSTPAVTINPAATKLAATKLADEPNTRSEAQPAPAASSSDGKQKFADLALSDSVKAAVQQSGYDTPTEVQAQIIPHMLEGRDVLAQSQTGTGKTAAFALPILSRIQTDKRETQVLVLAPTRELAMQVAESFETYGSEVRGFQVAAIYGGAGYENQIRQLKRASVVVGTPGRVIDHIKKGTLKLSTLDCLVLDEADEMLNMGFLEDVQFVLEHTPENRQVALFSATMPGPIRNIADRYLSDPVKITVKQKTMTAEAIRQRAVFVSPRDKMEVLARFLEVEETDGVIVFARTREATATVADELNARGLRAAALNGDMPQQVRERTVDQLKAGRLNIVVATDVAARGLDVPRIRHVFNYDVPMDNESYIHRIGRTGRAGKEGHAILFVTGGQKNRLRSIERATRQPIEIVEAPTADQVNDVRKKTFLASIDQTIGKRDLSFFKQMLSDHAAATEVELIDIAAALADQLQQGRPFFAEDLPKTRRRDNDRSRDDRGGRDRFERGGDRGADRGGRQDRRRSGGPPRGGMQRYRIEVGRADNVKPGNIVGAVANEGGIDGDQIGPISIYDDYSTVDLPDGMPQDVFQTLRKVRVAGKQLQLSRATPSDDQEQKRFGGKKFGDRNGGGGGGRRFGGGGGRGGSGGGFKGKRKFRRD